MRLHLNPEILKLVNHIILHRLILLIYRLSEDQSDSLERIRHCLRLTEMLEIMKLVDHIIVHELIPLMQLFEFRVQLVN